MFKFGPDRFCSAMTGVWPCRYLAGWGYVVSWDSMQHVIRKADLYQEQPLLAPKWYAGLHWEDVMIGLLLNNYATIQSHGGEYSTIGRETQDPAVIGCTHDAAVSSLCLVKQTAAQICAAEGLQAVTCSSTYARGLLDAGIKAAWKSCEPDTIIRHLDVEAQQLMAVLHEADQAGIWDHQAISCKSDPHSYADNDYWDWKRWRDTLKDVPTV